MTGQSIQAVRPLRILLVENHSDTLYWLTILLEDFGHTVSTARNVAEAGSKLSSDACEVLICDVGLPDGTGWELLTSVRLSRPLFAIAISGFGTLTDIERSHDAGFRTHLLKPFKAAELEKLLAEAAAELLPGEHRNC